MVFAWTILLQVCKALNMSGKCIIHSISRIKLAFRENKTLWISIWYSNCEIKMPQTKDGLQYVKQWVKLIIIRTSYTRPWHQRVVHLACLRVRSVSGTYRSTRVRRSWDTMSLMSCVWRSPGTTDSLYQLVSQICIWDLQEHTCKKVLGYHEFDVVCLAFSRDDRFLISVGK